MPINFINTNNSGGISIYQNNDNTTVNNIILQTNPPSGPIPGIYSNFEQYIINGVRQATTTSLIRSNITTSRRLIVTSTISIEGFRFLRIPPSNWTVINNGNLRPTLFVVTGQGGTIDGTTNSKQFYNETRILNPADAGSRANTTSQYDTYIMRPTNLSLTTLTPGQYDLSVFSTGANFDLAVLTNTVFPIDTSGNIYPSSTAATTHFALQIF